MSARSTTGTWVVESGRYLFGPFDGRTPAVTFARKLVHQGYPCVARRVHMRSDAVKAVAADAARSLNRVPVSTQWLLEEATA